MSADGLQWSFIPRSGVTFSDGSPLTAAEIAVSLNLARTSPPLLRPLRRRDGHRRRQRHGDRHPEPR
ncbi:MAG: hypothetical protein ACLVDP_15495 [Flavonifractor plautii]